MWSQNTLQACWDIIAIWVEHVAITITSTVFPNIRKAIQGQHDSSTVPGSQVSTPPYRRSESHGQVISACTSLAGICHTVTPSCREPGNAVRLAVSYCHVKERMGITGQLRVSTLPPCSQIWPSLELESFLRTVYLRRWGHNTPIILLFLGRWKLWNCFNYFNDSIPNSKRHLCKSCSKQLSQVIWN